MGSEEQGEKTRLIHAFAPGRHGQGRCGNRCAANETKTIERNQKATIAFHRAKRQGKSMNVFAKMVATLVRNEGVAGSNPATPTTHFNDLGFWRFDRANVSANDRPCIGGFSAFVLAGNWPSLGQETTP